MKNIPKSISPLGQKSRILAFAINSIVAWLIYFLATGQLSPIGTDAGIWVLAVIAYWLLVLVTVPFFNPPKDSLATAISVLLLLTPINLAVVQNFSSILVGLRTTTLALAVAVALFALLAILLHPQKTFWQKMFYELSEKLGRGEVLFTPIVIISALGFYQGQIEWALLILGFWVLMVAVRPVELFLRIVIYFHKLATGKVILTEAVGSIQRIDDPNVIRVRLFDLNKDWKSGRLYVAHLSNDKKFLVLPLFTQVQDEDTSGTGLLCNEYTAPFHTTPGNVYTLDASDDLVNEQLMFVGSEQAGGVVTGIIHEGSSIANIKFQVVDGSNLEEGKIVSTILRDKRVYYQILDANTEEEQFQQNPLGMHIVSASQLGFYDVQSGFKKFPWLPRMNQPVFLVTENEAPEPVLKDDEFVVGNVPSTSFAVPAKLGELIEYHTAILGKTGTAKTELAFDIIRQALARNTKIFCVDFTAEYRPRLKDCEPELIDFDKDDQRRLEKLLFAIDAKGFKADSEKQEMDKLLREKIRPAIKTKIVEFLEKKGSSLGIFELAEITNTRTTLRITEIYLSEIMNWARDNRKKRRVLIVLEEAHTIVPEAFGSFDANTKWVVERIGQIALQGRKYGVGLLLISQRTALVSKTVLSQCHTYFTHELIDKTSLDYLAGIFSTEHIKAIPNLRFLNLIAYGAGVKSEHPILIERKYDEKKKTASDALNVKDDEEEKA